MSGDHAAVSDVSFVTSTSWVRHDAPNKKAEDETVCYLVKAVAHVNGWCSDGIVINRDKSKKS
jgi:hypothetical protein